MAKHPLNQQRPGVIQIPQPNQKLPISNQINFPFVSYEKKIQILKQKNNLGQQQIQQQQQPQNQPQPKFSNFENGIKAKILICKLCSASFNFDLSVNRVNIEKHFLIVHRVNLNEKIPLFLAKLSLTLAQCADKNQGQELIFSNDVFVIKRVSMSSPNSSAMLMSAASSNANAIKTLSNNAVVATPLTLVQNGAVTISTLSKEYKRSIQNFEEQMINKNKNVVSNYLTLIAPLVTENASLPTETSKISPSGYTRSLKINQILNNQGYCFFFILKLP